MKNERGGETQSWEGGGGGGKTSKNGEKVPFFRKFSS